jgi:epoxyqueuosine reductase
LDPVRIALESGADLAGLAGVQPLREQGAIEPGLLPSAKTVIVVASAHSRTALASSNLQVRQYDTISTYENVRVVGDRIVRQLERLGYEALSVPAFIPIDMAEGKFGMVGALNHRAAAVAAGMGSYGKSGLLLTREFGPRVRLGSVLTSWEGDFPPPSPLSLCPEGCTACLEACPPGALLGEGRIDKTKCGRTIFQYGLRRVIRFIGEMMEGDPQKRRDLLKGFTLREIWQNFMAGNYYYCFQCQSVCPIGTPARRPSRGKSGRSPRSESSGRHRRSPGKARFGGFHHPADSQAAGRNPCPGPE